MDTSKEEELDTVKQVPEKNRIVAVKINKTWFNNYFYID